MKQSTSSIITFEVVTDHPQFVLKYSRETPFAEFIIRDGVLYDEPLACETRRILAEASPGKKYLLLVHSDGFFRVTRKVRRLGASKDFSSHLSAVAFFTSNSSLALLGELYNKINKPAVPTRVFSSRESAEEWLISRLPLL
jgi:hypothetical protein